QFTEWLESDTGFATVVRILEGEGVKMLKLREAAEKELRKDIAECGSEAFPLVVVAPELIQGIHTLVQAYGIGPLKVNTVLLNWFEHEPTIKRGIREILYGRRIKTAFRLGCNIIVFKANDKDWECVKKIPAQERRIDVWWWDDASSHLMLLLAYLTTRNKDWQGARIRVLAPGFEHPTEEAMAVFRQKLENYRIEAESETVFNAKASNVIGYSLGSSLVFLPFRLKGNRPVDPFGQPVEEILADLPLTALVLAAEDVELEAEPEEGKAAEIATAVDAMTDAAKRAQDAEKNATAAAEALTVAKEKLQQQIESETSDSAKIAALEADIAAAEKQAAKMARRSAKAAAKAIAAAKAVEELGGQTETPAENGAKSTDREPD
ncbi:MAG: amino acid permease, partial [Desulfobacterales bacterium]